MTHTEREWRDGHPEGAALDESTGPAGQLHEGDPLVETVHEDDPLVEDVDGGGRPAEPAHDGPPGVASSAGAGQARRPGGLGSADDQERFVARWQEIQAAFVDEPRRAVLDADALVVDMMDRLARMLASEREQLELPGKAGEVSTEDLRQGLQRYRALFERLLAV
jgi:hypothetical protein